ncbi:MAG: L-aspartate oxidase [Enterococcaceae bacterium]|jgi:L-aspartate oxidase|nr:L-aspartate oxidase [Enterococcaceae bacterium]MCI1919271.1 L-aspartate oxidase [Enterococcaceae bacterium]
MKKVLIVGSGLAGTRTAYYLQNTCEVSIYTKGRRTECNSYLAQGGVAAAVPEKDSWHAHAEDTLKAGVHHNDVRAVETLTKEGVAVIHELINEGMAFDRNPDGTLRFGLEGAHRLPRILHCHGDQTGKYVTLFVQSELNNVAWHENCPVVSLIVTEGRCTGIRYFDEHGELQSAFADFVILATGGLGGLFPLSTNDQTITGDGMAMALRAGAALSDMEFIQFHPTLLTKNEKCYGLISEAVRGAGAILVDEDDAPLMKDYPLKDLSPRDVVARVLTTAYAEGKKVFLDISAIHDFEERFPQITANLQKHQIPYRTTKRIPVRPGAHFMMGGIQTDLNGRTSLPNLYAVGETACTGVHGANRLASNSLLECLVFSERAARQILSTPTVPENKHAAHLPSAAVFKLPSRSELQTHAWRELGIERTEAGLLDLLAWLARYQFFDLPPAFLFSELETANLCLIAQFAAQAALKRTKSLGAHYRKDEHYEQHSA